MWHASQQVSAFCEPAKCYHTAHGGCQGWYGRGPFRLGDLLGHLDVSMNSHIRFLCMAGLGWLIPRWSRSTRFHRGFVSSLAEPGDFQAHSTPRTLKFPVTSPPCSSDPSGAAFLGCSCLIPQLRPLDVAQMKRAALPHCL